jgi:pyrroloquinoline quinone biosynthesis protein D
MDRRRRQPEPRTGATADGEREDDDAAATLARRPRLVRRARVRFDPARNAHVLLLPESVLVLTRTAAEILALCDGARSVADVIAALAERYPAAPIARDVTTLLARLRERGLIEDAAQPPP